MSSSLNPMITKYASEVNEEMIRLQEENTHLKTELSLLKSRYESDLDIQSKIIKSIDFKVLAEYFKLKGYTLCGECACFPEPLLKENCFKMLCEVLTTPNLTRTSIGRFTLERKDGILTIDYDNVYFWKFDLNTGECLWRKY